MDRHPRVASLLAARTVSRALLLNVAPVLLGLGWWLATRPFAAGTMLVGLASGALYWSFFEYATHRWLYHGRWFPVRLRPLAEAFHLHHHRHMADTRVLHAGPGIGYPVLGVLLAPAMLLARNHSPLVGWLAAGLVMSYAFYELVHHAIHYKEWTRGYLRKIQKYHLHHHDRRWNRNYGNTSSFWDRVMGTYDAGWSSWEIDEATRATFITSQHARPVPPDAGRLTELQKIAKRFTVAGVSRGRHNGLNLALTAVLVAAATALTAAAPKLGGWGWCLAPLAYGWILFAVIALVVHECSHDLFLLSADRVRTRALNRFVGRLVCTPLGIDYVAEWEHGHRIHHARPLTAGDPQNCAVPVGASLARLAGKIVVPGWLLWRSLRHRSTAAAFGCEAATVAPAWRLRDTALQVGSLALVVAVLSATMGLGRAAAVLAWIVMGFQVAALLNVVKVALEHGGAALSTQPDRRLRSRSSPGPLWRALLPFDVSMHFEHHLNAGVPWYRLRPLHKELRSTLTPGERAWIGAGAIRTGRTD